MLVDPFTVRGAAATLVAVFCVAVFGLTSTWSASAAPKRPMPPATWTNTRANWQVSCANYYTLYSSDTKAGNDKAADQDLQMAQTAGCDWAS